MAHCLFDTLNAPADKLLLSELNKLGGHSAISERYLPLAPRKEMNQSLGNSVAKAFLSCSLRTEDRPFINFIEQILQQHGISPIGTVGRYSASPINTAAHMRDNIPNCDFVVIVATPVGRMIISHHVSIECLA